MEADKAVEGEAVKEGNENVNVPGASEAGPADGGDLLGTNVSVEPTVEIPEGGQEVAPEAVPSSSPTPFPTESTESLKETDTSADTKIDDKNGSPSVPTDKARGVEAASEQMPQVPPTSSGEGGGDDGPAASGAAAPTTTAPADIKGKEKAQLGEGIVLHVLSVVFHHDKGSIIENAYPPIPQGKVESWKDLPCLAMPESAHSVDSDYTYFTLPNPDHPELPYHGVASYRQVKADEIEQKDEEVTRNTVQRALCVISVSPHFGFLHTRLRLFVDRHALVGDLYKTETLRTVFDSLNAEHPSYSDIFEGLSTRSLVHHYRHNVLVMIKLILLERRMLMFGMPASKPCTTLVTLLSLLPEQIQSNIPDFIRDRAIISAQQQMKKNNYAFPLKVFNGGTRFVRPYMGVELSDMLLDKGVKSFLVGASNPIFAHQKRFRIQAVINTKDATLELMDVLHAVVSLTPEDKDFMAFVVEAVESTWMSNEDEDYLEDRSKRPGSDVWVRDQFQAYIEGLLATAASYPSLINHGKEAFMSYDMGEVPSEKFDPVDMRNFECYGLPFVANWVMTQNFAEFAQRCNPTIKNFRPKPGMLALGPRRERRNTPAVRANPLSASGIADSLQSEFSRLMERATPHLQTVSYSLQQNFQHLSEATESMADQAVKTVQENAAKLVMAEPEPEETFEPMVVGKFTQPRLFSESMDREPDDAEESSAPNEGVSTSAAALETDEKKRPGPPILSALNSFSDKLSESWNVASEKVSDVVSSAQTKLAGNEVNELSGQGSQSSGGWFSSIRRSTQEFVQGLNKPSGNEEPPPSDK